MKFSTKAKNLLIFKNLNLKKSIIPKFYKFYVDEIFKNKKSINKIIHNNLSRKISIRSSFYLEDKKGQSMAGEFEGFSNITNLKDNIDYFTGKLIKQYKKKTKKKLYFMKSEILYQNFINNSILSGVVTNRCLKDGTEYYVINYDDTSNKTNTVTSGGKKSSRVLNIFKKNSNNVRSPKFRKIIESVKEIESKISGVPIDIEFAVDKNKKVNIFQIRPLSTLRNWKNFSNRKFRSSLKSNQNKFLKILKENKKYGNDPIFGLMPDWNPAEMIGYQPNMLSYSIYKEIITDNSWSLARAKMGYKYVNKPLMYSFSGKPFIDTRLSLIP